MVTLFSAALAALSGPPSQVGGPTAAAIIVDHR